MTAPSFITEASVRDYLGLNSVSSDSRYSDSTLGSNIRAASWTLERATGRFFGDRTQTLTFTTNGAAFITIPGLRSASSIASYGTALTVDESYWLIPDAQQSGIYTGVQLRAFTSGQNGPWWLHYSSWFDQNLDSYLHPNNRGASSSPNDLVIAGTWGYTAADFPEPVRHATKVLAAYYTKRPDAILSGGITTPDGNSFDLSRFPVEVQAFIKDWRVGPWVYGL